VGLAPVSDAAAGEAFTSDFTGPRHRLRESLLLRAFLAADPGPRVLNAGAGQGSFSLLLEGRGFDVTSLDSSPAEIALLRRRVRGPVVEARLEELPFEPASFDAAVLGEVLEHIPDDAEALRQVARVVRPGGAIAISVPRNPEYFGVSDEWAGHVRRYTCEALLGVVADAGLRVEQCRAWGFPCSTLYHRFLYEPRLRRKGPASPGGSQGLALKGLGAVLQVDRLFVGVERGSLGYIAVARS
jgi:SAM-dependent methyltransferase